MMEGEMDEYLGYEKSEHLDNHDSRNGYKSKHATNQALAAWR